VLHYVTRAEAGGQGIAVVRARLETLQDYLMATGLGAGHTVWEVEELDWSASHPANAQFYQANLPWVAGSLTAHCLVGEAP
jgi:hypothetical protein